MTAIVVLDVETTGKDRARDQIVELCIQLGIHDGAEMRGWRIRPTVPIHPEAQAVHGITAESLAACHPFSEHAPQIVAILMSADVIVGYNVAFDLDIIQAELQRAGMPPLDLLSKQVVDVLRLWHHVEPRTLVSAHERFVGRPLTDAHAAGADVAATASVLNAMLERFGLAAAGWHDIAKLSNPFPERANWIGPSHHLRWAAAGAVFGFGKYSGSQVASVDTGFLTWVLGKDFPLHVKEVCQAALRMPAAELEVWIAARYPRPVAEAA